MAYLLFMLLNLVSAQYDQLEPGWENKLLLPVIEDPEHFQKILSDHQEKHIFIDIFTPGCIYCFKVYPDVNRMYEDLIK